jgi:hypothetical protein
MSTDPESDDESSSPLFTMAILLYMLAGGFDTEVEARNRKRRARYKRLSEEAKRRRVRKVPRIATVAPSQSCWERLYQSKSLEGFITSTGVDPRCFEQLLELFAPLFTANSPYSKDGSIRLVNGDETRGRPRMIAPSSCLGLVLYWSRTSCHIWSLAQYFGMTASPCCLWLRFGKRLLLNILAKREDAQIKLPAEAKLRQYVACVSNKYPRLNNVAYVGDGLKVLLQKAGNNGKQNAFYSGWKTDHFITNLFVFAPDGTIIMCMLNCPGSMHDSELASMGNPSIYQKIDSLFEKYGTKCVMDSAFSTRDRQSIIKSVQRDAVYITAENVEEALVLEDAKSVRQSAEWGMRALQGSMPRLKARWSYEERDERLVGLTLLVLLYNYKANTMDLNQIRTVYWNALYGDGY